MVVVVALALLRACAAEPMRRLRNGFKIPLVGFGVGNQDHALIPGVLEVYRMSGDLDYLIKAVVADMPDYDRLYKQLIKADIYDVSSSFVMETLRHTTCLPL